MGKITTDMGQERIHVHFSEYLEERQLKDFYKIYKKATGQLVQEYVEEDGALLARTDGRSSIRIGWSGTRGCFVRADRSDAVELADILFGMLSYRYAEFKAFEPILGTLSAMDAKTAIAGAKAIIEERGLDESMEEDLRAILSIKHLAPAGARS